MGCVDKLIPVGNGKQQMDSITWEVLEWREMTKIFSKSEALSHAPNDPLCVRLYLRLKVIQESSDFSLSTILYYQSILLVLK